MKNNEAMYAHFGKNHAHRCGECSNLIAFRAGRTWFKCRRYGTGRSISTDWRKSWTACGKFNVPLAPGEKPMIRRLPPTRKATEPVPGQTCMWKQNDAAKGTGTDADS